MHFLHLITASAPTVSKTIHHWIYSVGGLGFILLGLLDNSIIPLPGSMDVLLILLSARQSQLWLYYGIMATIGSVIGGFVTYRIARKGGKGALEKRLSRKRLNRVYKIFERWGFWSVAIPAILPPPVPMTAFLLAAGALQYPIKKFLLALSIGRFLRYSVLAFLSARYGRQILDFIKREGHPLPVALSVLMVVAIIVCFYFFVNKRHKPA
jgi:membrane protein YqaA with SNARE-associated domain